MAHHSGGGFIARQGASAWRSSSDRAAVCRHAALEDNALGKSTAAVMFLVLTTLVVTKTGPLAMRLPPAAGPTAGPRGRRHDLTHTLALCLPLT